MTTETLIKRPEGYERSNQDIMSNFDHRVIPEIVERCMKENITADYPAVNFFAQVWFDKEESKWYAEVWRHHSHVATFKEDSPDQLRIAISDEYGYE